MLLEALAYDPRRPPTSVLTFLAGLDDLCVRFIINLPGDSLESVERICFQVEEAQWFYEDFIRPLDPNLPSLSLRSFCLRIFTHCPLLSGFAVDGLHMQAFEEFLTYKKRIPVRGAIMLNEAMDAAVLVKGWKKGANWSFPRGKINKDEDDLICAIREVYEETGFDLDAAGLVPEKEAVKHIEVNMREQQMRLYVFKNVPMDTYFEPRTRKEISKIQWWRLSELPAFKKKNQSSNPETTTNANKFYMVAPFLVPLRKWVIEQKKLDAKKRTSNQYLSAGMSHDEFLTEEDRGEESGTQAPYEVSAPESARHEEANEALGRLLKIQPPTQGLQSEALGAASLSQTSNSGQALLALLKSNPTNKPAGINPPPQSHIGQIETPRSVPNPPYQQQPHPPTFPEMPPAPHFPHVQDIPFSYQVPNFHRPNYQEQMMQNRPQMQQDHMMQNHPQMQQSRPFQNPNSHQSQHLIHPQPLPPHVQRAVFTGGAIHSPTIPHSVQHESFQPNNLATSMGGMMNAQFPNMHVPQAQQLQRESPPKLTGHSLALLNAFKGGDKAFNGHEAHGPALAPFVQGPSGKQVQPHPQELPAEHLQPQQAPISHLNTHSIPNHLSPRQPPSATQKSTLLSMFKSPVAQVTTPAKVPNATALPISSTPSAVELSAVEPLSTSTIIPEQTPNAKQNTKVPELNAEVNLPFGAMSILSRPAEKQENKPRSEQVPHKHQNQGSAKKASASFAGKGKTVPPVNKVFQPQILKRPQPGSSKEPTLPVLPSPKIANVAPLPTVDSQAPASPAVHKQTLLSLFGKSTQAAPLSPNNSAAERVPQVNNTIETPSRSRVGSIASGEAAPRRGSQTPISSADNRFLLSYLDAIVGGNKR